MGSPIARGAHEFSHSQRKQEAAESSKPDLEFENRFTFPTTSLRKIGECGCSACKHEPCCSPFFFARRVERRIRKDQDCLAEERTTRIAEKSQEKLERNLRKKRQRIRFVGVSVNIGSGNVARRKEEDHRRREGSGARSAHWNTVASGGSWPWSLTGES